ncbi:DUF6538 domain-containing protein [Geomonas propionica]|uniref:Tyrosine-type recombinase/integrase n=1 Tax=Geomonas propionica TaxID=2798582 RepID=A0ABS0YQ94_9BACT|nr:DUF6538 domain-containing protein [Geomonas propionica]MBJ6800161.1 tyrosine-type recombinase/integrase [Geomonas propionica]
MFYLTKINKTYQFRLRIPSDLLPHFQQREIRRTLRTTRYREAKTLLHKFTAETERIFTLIRSNTLPDDVLQKIIDTYLNASITLFERQRNREPISADPRRQHRVQDGDDLLSQVIESDEGFDLYQEMIENDIAKSKRLLGRRKGQEVPQVVRAADMFMKKFDLDLGNDSPEYAKLCNELLKAKIKADTVNNEHLNGNYDTDYDVERRNRKQSKSLKELIDIYERDKMDTWSSPKRLQSTHRQILHIIGDVPLDAIDREVSIDLRDALKEYPRSLQKKDMSAPWRELAKKRKGRLSGGSQHFILTEFSTLIDYGKTHEYGIKGSPADGLAGSKDDIKRMKIRTPYTQEELQRMIGVLAGVDREKEPETFWLPLLFAYTGARANEACMLRCADIEQRGDVWVICFRNREEFHQKTKNSKDRQAPIHRDLVRLGFLKYVEAQKASGKDRLFDNLVLYEGKWNKYYGKDFNRTFKQKFLKGYIKEQLAEKDLHSFRMTMISWFVQRKDLATVPNISILQSIIGHFEAADLTNKMEFIKDAQLTLGTYGGGYGKEHEQNELLQHLDYGLDLSPLLSN